MLVEILQLEFNFKVTTHEQNLYCVKIKGEMIFICWQVDGFAVASNTTAATDYNISVIDKHVSTTNKGLRTKYNGLNVLQACDYIKLHCESYINRILLLHGWTEPSPKESNQN